MTVVQGLTEVASEKMESARKKLEEYRKEQATIGAKRRKVAEKYSSTLENHYRNRFIKLLKNLIFFKMSMS